MSSLGFSGGYWRFFALTTGQSWVSNHSCLLVHLSLFSLLRVSFRGDLMSFCPLRLFAPALWDSFFSCVSPTQHTANLFYFLPDDFCCRTDSQWTIRTLLAGARETLGDTELKGTQKVRQRYASGTPQQSHPNPHRPKSHIPNNFYACDYCHCLSIGTKLKIPKNFKFQNMHPGTNDVGIYPLFSGHIGQNFRARKVLCLTHHTQAREMFYGRRRMFVPPEYPGQFQTSGSIFRP